MITQEGGRGIENECLPGGVELGPEGSGVGVPFPLQLHACGLHSHCHCPQSCSTVSCLDKGHRLLIVL